MTRWFRSRDPGWLTRCGILVLGLSLACLPLACQRSNEKFASLNIEHEVSPEPARVGQATIKLKLTDEAGKAVTGARLTLEGNMSHAGMTPEFRDAKEVGPGQYQAPFEFSMAGDWVVLVHLTLANGLKVDRQFSINGVRAS